MSISQWPNSVRSLAACGRSEMWLSCQAAAALDRPVALPAASRTLAQAQVEVASGPLVGQDVLIDRLMADPKRAIAPQPAADLIGAEAFVEKLLDQHPLLGCQLRPAATAGALLGLAGPVRAIEARCVATYLATDGARVPVQTASDLGIRIALPAECSQRIPLCGSDLVIGHDDPFLAEDSSVSQIAPFSSKRCCT